MFSCVILTAAGDRILLLSYSTWNWQRRGRTRANWSRLINFRGFEPHVGVHLSARKQTYSHLPSIWLARKWLVAAWNLRSINDKPVWHSQVISLSVDGSSLAEGKVNFWALYSNFANILRRTGRVYPRMLSMSRIAGREKFFRRSATFASGWVWKIAASGRFPPAIEANQEKNDLVISMTQYLEKSGEDVGVASRVWEK